MAIVEDVDLFGNILDRFTDGTAFDEHLAELPSGVPRYYEEDGLGSVTSLTTSTGGTANTYSYDSFGNLTNASGAAANPYQYTGRDFDSESGLYYYRARYYDAVAGRFTSEDPYRSLFGLNRYKYVSNHPLTFNDPLGLSETCAPNGETQLTPWIPYSTSITPITGWALSWADETEGPHDPEGGSPAASEGIWKHILAVRDSFRCSR